MKIKDITRALLFAALLLAMPAIAGAAGHIAPVGVTTRGASQLIVWYDETGPAEGVAFAGSSLFQITNSSNDTAVNIHVQIFADFDGPEFGDSSLCREHDFNDTLTPSDTVLYRLAALNQTDDGGPAVAPFTSGNNSGAVIPIDIDSTRGFIVATAVNQVTLPRQAISHNFLFGSIVIYLNDSTSDMAVSLEAMGREAVDVATGALAAPGTILDGVSNALRLLQPSALYFAYDSETLEGEDDANVVSISFEDDYSDPSGEYRATPSTVGWDPIGFDQFEVGISCPHRENTCFVTRTIDDSWDSEIDDGSGTDPNPPMEAVDFPANSEDRLCPSVDQAQAEEDLGFVRIRVTGLTGLENNIGTLELEDDDGSNAAIASWMHAE